MIKVLWFLVVFKNKKPSDSKSLLVGKGGFEPPTLLFFQNNYNRLATLPCNPCGSLRLINHKSIKSKNNNRLTSSLFNRGFGIFAFKNRERRT